MAKVLTQTFSADRDTNIIDVALTAGTAIIGNVSIDQTTPGTTNGVVTKTGSVVGIPSTISTVNSTTANLAGAAVFTGTAEDISNFAEVRVSVFSSHASATNGLSLQQSSDGTNWDSVDTYSVSAATGIVLGFGVAAKFFRLVYTNGATLTTSLRIQTIYHVTRTKPTSQRPQDTLSNELDTEEVMAMNMVFNGTTWDRTRGDITNGIDVDVTRVTGTVTVAGAAASGAAKAGNPVQLGGVFNTTPPTVTTGQAVELQTTNRGFIIVSGPDAPGIAPTGNPLNVAYRVATANPAVQTNGLLVRTMADKVGRTVPSTSHIRELSLQQTTTITASVAETTIVTAVASTFNDLTALTLSNSSAATSITVALKSTTAGATVATYTVPANATVHLTFPTPFTQAAVNTNWTITCSGVVTSLFVTAHYVQNI